MSEPKEVSPQFDDFDSEPILKWGEASVEWCDEFVNGLGEKKKIEEFEHWSLGWKHGVIGFDGLGKDDEVKARKAGALFIYLWTRGVSPDIAERCAVSYVLSYTIGKV